MNVLRVSALAVSLLAGCVSPAPATTEPAPAASPTDAATVTQSSPSASASPSVSAIVSPSSEPSAAAKPFTLVALGDSIPYNSSDDCPGCTGFVDSYASALETELGVSVKVVNQSRHDGARTRDILRQVRSDASLREQLGAADIVLISVAFNDQPPFADPHRGCPPATEGSASDADYVQAAAVTSHACIDSAVPLIRDGVAQVFAGIREVAPEVAIGVLTAYDTWRGWDYLDQFDEPTRSAVLDAETYWFQTWNAALCDEAAVIDAVCVDVYRAFNGADGTEPAGDYLSGDYTHPSQKGNDVIRDLLIEAALPARRPS